MKSPFGWSAAALLAVALAVPARAQESASMSEQLFASITWQEGPDTARIGSESTVVVPENCQFTDAAGARAFMLATENPPSGAELGVLLCFSTPESEPWFVVFTFDPSGYVRDTDAKDLDADAILTSIREGGERANEERRRNGWAPVTTTGWVREPFYDPRTNNLTWATQVVSDGSAPAVNHSVRLLGRGGVMSADLVISPAQLATAMPEFDRIVAGHAFVPGRRYSEWRAGDKMADYGLTALVAGGAGAIAVKSGILPKLLKLLAVAALGALAWVKSLFSGKKRKAEEAA